MNAVTLNNLYPGKPGPQVGDRLLVMDGNTGQSSVIQGDSSEKELNCRSEAVVKSLYEQLGPAALSKTIKLLGRRDVAEEVLQEVFLKLWKSALTCPNLRAAYVWI